MHLFLKLQDSDDPHLLLEQDIIHVSEAFVLELVLVIERLERHKPDIVTVVTYRLMPIGPSALHHCCPNICLVR